MEETPDSDGNNHRLCIKQLNLKNSLKLKVQLLRYSV